MSSRRRRSAAFTASVTVAMLLGSLVMAAVLAASGAPRAIVVGLVLAALPVGPLVACFVWLDRYEPEPRRLLAAGLAWGALVATSAALVLQLADSVLFMRTEAFSATVVAPITEEAAKALFIFLLLWTRRQEIDGVLDGIVYAGMVGIGFAFTENILYYAAAYTGDGEVPGGAASATATFVVRGVLSPFAHPFFTVFIGIGIGYAVLSRSRAVRVWAPLGGYAAAVATHALWNGSIFLGGGLAFIGTYVLLMVPGFFLMVAFVLWVRRREGRMLGRALGDCARRGLVLPHEVPWLVDLTARRVARAHARRAGGRAAAEVLQDFQDTATELGFLHDRFLRGVPPADVGPRGQALVDRLAALRPSLILPAPGWPSATTAAVPGAVGPGPYAGGGAR